MGALLGHDHGAAGTDAHHMGSPLQQLHRLENPFRVHQPDGLGHGVVGQPGNLQAASADASRFLLAGGGAGGAMAGYALAKKRFYGRTILFSLIVCAMALPKQVILIPLVREMSALGLYDTIWSVIIPIVGWPFGVFLLKQFAEGIPTEMVEACRIDGASEWRTFTDVMFPMIKPGVGACAIFTFINSWNDYFMQLIMLMSTKELTISVGIATMQGENSTDFGILMAGSALASVPIIIVFLIFQKYFTKGITMGAVKG